MASFLSYMLAVAAEMAGGILLHLICKWLDRWIDSDSPDTKK